jgi:hypothetical protein
MNLGLTFLRIIPLITLMTGVLLPTNIAKAASDVPTNKASLKQEIVEDHKQTGEHRQTEEDHQIAGIPQLLLSKKAQTIEFSIFLSTILLSIFVPELFYNPIKNVQRLENIQRPKSSAKDNLQPEQIGKIELPLPPLKVIPEKTKTSTLVRDKSAKINNQAKIKSENQSQQDQEAA